MASVTGCTVTTSVGGSGKSAVEYNTDYLMDEFDFDEATAQIIADKLDEKDFGKIVTKKLKIVNGTGSITIGDMKNKYVINVEDGYISTITNKDGIVIMTLEEIQNAALPTGSSSGDLMTDTNTTNDVTEPEQPAETNNTVEQQPADNSSSDTASYISDEAKKILASLDTDYNKVNWGVQYSPTGMDGIVISVAPYVDSDSYYLAVAVTNLYGEDTTFSATGYAKGLSGQEIGSLSFYETAICPGNTVVKLIYCDDVPTGEIHWDEIELPNVYETSAYWESDWSLGTDADGYLKVDYTIMSNTTMMPGYVTGLVLDKKGNIVAAYQDYNSNKGSNASGIIKYYVKASNLSGTPSDVAMFCNPLEEN